MPHLQQYFAESLLGIWCIDIADKYPSAEVRMYAGHRVVYSSKIL
jgi:hypothetical protein